jgi:hypothetical protein
MWKLKMTLTNPGGADPIVAAVMESMVETGN